MRVKPPIVRFSSAPRRSSPAPMSAGPSCAASIRCPTRTFSCCRIQRRRSWKRRRRTWIWPSVFGLTSPFVLYPAQFWPHKNHANLVLAAAHLRRGGLDVALALPGSDKGNRGFIESVASREGVGDLVKPLGFVSRAELVALYRKSLALAYVSWCGPENLPPLEAFALGCPVIATRIPGAEEQLADAAHFCEPGDPASIADAIALLHRDPARRTALIEAGRVRCRRFTPRDYVAGVMDYFDAFDAVRRCWP